MKKNIEIRTIDIAPQSTEEGVIEGYAVVYGVESRVLTDWDGEFIEIIEPGAVTEDLIRKSDVKALFNHNQNYLLARSVQGDGTLGLKADERGLFFRFQSPNTTAGRDVRELVQRGDIRGCSFAFTVNEKDVRYEWRGDQRVRIVSKLSGLYDVSLVVEPAYVQTSVDARSFCTEPQGRSIAECRREISLLKECD